MNEVTIIEKSGVARVSYVPRLSRNQVKVQPFDGNIQRHSISSKNITITSSFLSTPSNYYLAKPSSIENSDESSGASDTKQITLVNIPNSSTVLTDQDKLIQSQSKLGQRFINWYNRLTYKQKILFISAIVILIISILALIIVPPIYVFLIRQVPSQSSFTNETVSSCSTATCIGQETPYQSSIVTALYAFDGNTNDQTGYMTGTAFGTSSPTFDVNAYVGEAILFDSTAQEYVEIPNVNLANQSFTLQTWINTATLSMTTDYGIFSQCDSKSICLSYSLRNGRIVFSLDSMNASSTTLTGSTLISYTDWIHVTVVYDAILLQQQIYLDGLIDAVSNGMVNAYQGASTSRTTTTAIGRSSAYSYGTTYYDRKIDHFTISAGVARSACEIYNDASLVAYYPFDINATNNDHSVYLCNGVSLATTVVSSGRVNQALSFTLNTSYFESQCYPKFRGAYSSFSFSLWIYPTSTKGGTLVHISSNPNGDGTCYDVLVFSSTGALVFQWLLTTGNVNNAQGPVISTNTWTHVAVVYGQTSGVRLFINGQFSTASPNTGNLNLQDHSSPYYITVGNKSPLGPATTFTCLTGTIPISSGSYSGYIDEFRLYNRELNSQEICVLANP